MEIELQTGDPPPRSGVFVIETDGEPYINKSSNMRKRVERLLAAAPEEKSKRLNLHGAARAVRFRETGSPFESNLLLWHLHRQHFPDSYRQRMRLRPPMLVKLSWENEYPRCYLTRRIGGAANLHFGPFPSRAAAERFLQSFLDLFMIRRCVETIHPDPAHPGCIYGEMKMCLRPCQAAATREAYLEEAAKVREFLETRGRSMLRALEQSREDAVAELEFERAAEIHKRLEKTKAALDLPELTCDLEHLHGIIVQRSAAADSVELFPVYRGYLQPPIRFALGTRAAAPPPADAPPGADPPPGAEAPSAAPPPAVASTNTLDSRIREALSCIQPRAEGRRTEQLALISRWFYRGTRTGEWIGFESFDRLPIRRLANAIGRVARSEKGEAEAVL